MTWSAGPSVPTRTFAELYRPYKRKTTGPSRPRLEKTIATSGCDRIIDDLNKDSVTDVIINPLQAGSTLYGCLELNLKASANRKVISGMTTVSSAMVKGTLMAINGSPIISRRYKPDTGLQPRRYHRRLTRQESPHDYSMDQPSLTERTSSSPKAASLVRMSF